MPKTPIRAATEGLPNLTRRRLLAGFGAATALAVVGGVVEAAAVESDVPIRKIVLADGTVVDSIDHRLELLERVAPEAARRLRVRIGALLDAAEVVVRAEKSGSAEAVAVAAGLLQDQLTALHGGRWDTQTDHVNGLVAVSRAHAGGKAAA
ncbi:hypothetical protein NKH53_23250 [Mesorhizobium australicum]|uniref:hypothetical protein n=1 Tax=Mesorhizobium australicum TaxID=536018 RepID=UPI0033355225